MTQGTRPQLRDSDAPWLTKTPQHWKVKKLKFLASVNPSNVDKKTEEGEISVRLCNYVDVYRNEFIRDSMNFMDASATKEEIEKFSIAVGDVMVTKDSETPDDIAIPALVVEPCEGVLCGYHLTHIRARGISGRYLFRLFQSKGFNAQFIVAANGVTRFGLPQYAIANAYVTIPPRDEQERIAGLLDSKTEQIDALIVKKRALLDKLAEKRKALISRAMTTGLNPVVERRTTETIWLNSIPRHWEVRRLKYVSHSMQTGPFGSQLHSAEYVEDGIPVINPADILDGKLIANPKNTVDESVAERLSRHKLIEGDIVIGRRGEMGRAGIVREDNVGWLCGTGSLRARLNRELVMPEFVLYQFSLAGVSDFLSLQSVGSTMDNLNTTILGNISIAVPPLPEQQEILDYLDSACKKLDTQRTKVRQVIDALTEYRSSLISHAVTGQIDVSGVSIPHEPTPSNRVLEA